MAVETKITRQDLKFYPSERLTDNEDGGGMPLGTPIKGEANEMFNPISSIARINGGFYTRLAYAGVSREDDEPLIGSHLAITKPPQDPKVSYLLFKATKYGELREEIIKRIEAYSVASIESRMTLLSTQSQNSKIIQAFQRPSEPLPLVGDVYCLRQDAAGYPFEEQYIQVVRVTSEDRNFTSNGKDFVRTVVEMEISAVLEADFVGAEYPSESYTSSPCKIRETNAVDAGKYYGVKPLVAAIAKESLQVQVPTVMEKLVPTNQVETRLTDLTAAGQRQTLFDGAKEGADGVVTIQVNKTHKAETVTNLYVGNAITPNSLIIETSVGQLVDTGGVLTWNGNAIGAISYQRGEVSVSEPSFAAYLSILRFRPAAAELRVSDTASIEITINNRSYNYVQTLDPVPAVGSLQVSYRAQGRWYDLYDDGSGVLRGSSAAYGSASINLVTGTLSISCGELPDVGSSIMIAWSTRGRYFNRAGVATAPKLLLQLTKNATPDSVSLVWNDGAAKTAASDAAGNITGDWTGQYDAQSRQIRIDTGANFNYPDAVLDITVTYSEGEKTFFGFSQPSTNPDGTITLSLGDQPIKPNTLRLKWNVDVTPENTNNSFLIPKDQIKTWVPQTIEVRDDGSGKVLNLAGEEVGTVDYLGRTLTFNPKTTVLAPQPVFDKVKFSFGRTNYYRYFFSNYEYKPVEATLPSDDTALVEVWFYDTSPQATTTEVLSGSQLEIDLLENYAEVIAPSSVNFTWGDHTYFDRQGSVLADIDPKTGAATTSGSLDYRSGKVLLNNWRWTDGAPPNVTSLVTSIDGNPVDAVTFRTPASPIRAGSLQLRATAVDGTKIDVISDLSGALTGSGIEGKVDAEYGVATTRFGQLVDAAGNESEPWYVADAVDENGKIWQPLYVFAETITFNAVAYSYLPVNTTVVKIDTVRLPQDGRVPIFRRGDTVLITNAVTDDIGSAHTGGATVSLSRSDVDRICVKDANDQPVNAELWDYDLDAGSITWATPLDLSSYTMPLSVEHVQEERNRVLTADIDGTLTLMFPTKRAYPIENTYVSSVLLGDDLQVRVSVPFTQRNWDGVWRDEPNGEQLLNKLNLTDYPMVLTDDGAIQERWMIRMTSDTQFELYGETLGFVMSGDTLTDLAPIRPATGKPYFVIPKEAFGNDAPWANQDIIRFDTWGTLLAAWVLCAVQPSPDAPEGEDGFTMCVFGDTTAV